MLSPACIGEAILLRSVDIPRSIPKIHDYAKVKVAILDHLEINPKTIPQKFNQEEYPHGSRPQVVARCLWDHCWCWLKPEKQNEVQVAERVVLEQFTQILPAGGREWVTHQWPLNLSEAASYMAGKDLAP